MASGKRKRDRELVAESSRSSKKHKHSSPKRDYTSREDAKPSTSSRKRNRQSRSVSVSQALAMKREARDGSPQSSATLQDEVKVEPDGDASILFVDGPSPKKKRKHKTKAKKEEDDLAFGEDKVEPDEVQALVTIASSAPVLLLDPKTEDALEEDIKPVLEEPSPKKISKKNKGKGKEEGWAVGLASSPKAADPPVVAAIAHVQSPEVEQLKLEIERMQKELLFKDEVLSAHRSVTTFLQDSLNCSICLMTFVDPLALSCGHVFCRKCLKDCFVHQRARSNEGPVRTECPSCRNANITRPFPVFVVRDLTAKMKLLEAAGGLLWVGEEAGSSPGRKSVGLPASEADEWHGFFPTQDRTVTYAHAVRRGLIDAEDGVQRCVNCNWEIEDGMCLHCGEQYDGGHLSDLDADFGLDHGHDLDLPSFRSDDDEGDLSDLVVPDETLSDDPDTSFLDPARRSAGDQALRQALRDRYGPDESESGSSSNDSEQEDDEGEGDAELDATVDLRDLTHQYSDDEDSRPAFTDEDGDDPQLLPPPRRPRQLDLNLPSGDDSSADSEDLEYGDSPDVSAQFQRIVRHATSDGVDPEEDSEPIAPRRRKKKIISSDSEDDIQVISAPAVRRPQLNPYLDEEAEDSEELEYTGATRGDDSRVARYGSLSPKSAAQAMMDYEDHLEADMEQEMLEQEIENDSEADNDIERDAEEEEEGALEGGMVEYSDIEEIDGPYYGQPQIYLDPSADVVDSEEDFLEGRESDAEGSLQMDSDGQLY